MDDVFEVIGDFLFDMPWEFIVTFLIGMAAGAGLMWWYL